MFKVIFEDCDDVWAKNPIFESLYINHKPLVLISVAAMNSPNPLLFDKTLRLF